MIIEILFFILGIVFLIKGADYLVEGASSLAKKLGVSSLIIGLTIVAFGTSMPELIVNIFSILNKATDVAFGNIIGSNISNILLVLGITAIITDINVHSSTVWKEIPFAMLAVITLFIVSNKLMINGTNIPLLQRADGLILLFFFTIFLYYAFGMIKNHQKRIDKGKLKIPEISNLKISFLIIIGLIGIYLGGKWTVDEAVFLAKSFGLSQFLISATIIALGTSLPELITSITAALKKDVDLAVGNVIGSNIFNIFWILGLTSLISPIKIPNFINEDLIILGISTFLLFSFMFIGERYQMNRKQGIAFVILYIFYIIFLIIRG